MTDTVTTSVAAPVSAMDPVPHRVSSRVQENRDTATLELTPVRQRIATPQPGQFMMLYAFGVGEVAISVSGHLSKPDGTITHTIRDVGAVSHALYAASPGDIIGVRGPFGTGWNLHRACGGDVVIVAGGVGLAPLRPVVLDVLADREGYGRVVLIVGARARNDFLFITELDAWAHAGLIEVDMTIDVPVQGWTGETGLVTQPLRRLTLDPRHTTAFVCGPEAMMRSSAQVLLEKGLAPNAIRVSLERNMQCGVGWCGHCQLGPLLLCRDGPVVGWDAAGPLLRVREL
ncbi:FAD/NAD(P)-binding protein [Mycobacterium sp. ACS4331]|uniref:FAD/NAD(P)-binding protein n=1 Tax=Mycobacterium sp. ACS4331 TaxID=1834121 RepID=UPI0008000430|nr:FAD/NAD(P)-binding protein [Mycobacterium sp. ACS4331]OBF29751.1 oxidoreductase [Mycobacterium sp. ACS4331]